MLEGWVAGGRIVQVRCRMRYEQLQTLFLAGNLCCLSSSGNMHVNETVGKAMREQRLERQGESSCLDLKIGKNA